MEAADFIAALRTLSGSNDMPTINGRISRFGLTAKLGLPRYALNDKQPAKRYVHLVPELYRFEESWIEGLERNLLAKLHETYKNGCLPITRSGQISIVEAQKALSFPDGSFTRWPWAIRCVQSFNSYLIEQREIAIKAKINEVEAWLGSTVPENWPLSPLGQLNALRLLKQFDISESTARSLLAENPRLQSIIEKADKSIEPQREKIRYKFTSKLDELNLLLDSPGLVVSGRKISILDLANKLGISTTGFNNTPALAKALKAKQDSIDFDFKNGLTKKSFKIRGVLCLNLGCKPFSEKAQRVYDFSQFISIFGLSFCELVGTAYFHIAEELSSASRLPYYELCNFFSWVEKNHDSYMQVLECFRRLAMPDAAAYERMVQEYVSEKWSNNVATNSRPVSISTLKKFGDMGVLPSLAHWPTWEFRNSEQTIHRPSLIEAEQISADTHAAHIIVEDAFKYRGLSGYKNLDINTFVSTLAAERAQRPDLPEKLVECMQLLCAERLDEIHSCASQVFYDAKSTLEVGDRLIKEGDFSGEEIWDRIGLDKPLDRSSRQQRSLLLSPVNDLEVTFRNLLAIIQYKFGSICPDPRSYNNFFALRYRSVGGVYRVQNHLLPSRHMLSSALTLYLVESGANVSVALSLAKDPIRDSPIVGHRRIVGVKARAGDAPIVEDLLIKAEGKKISAIQAIEILKLRSEPLRPVVEKRHADLFALYAYGSSVRVLSGSRFAEDMKLFAAKSEVLKNLNIYPSMLRPTKLLEVQLRNPADVGIAKQLADHRSTSSTFGYVGKLPFRILLEVKIRQFVETVQVVVMDDVENAKNRLGVSPTDWQRQIENAQRTGLGVFCRNPFNGPQPDFSDKRCLAVDRCIKCTRLLVIAEPESIADMIIWRDVLEKDQHQWMEQRLERWETVWLPWLAFFTVVLDEKMSRGVLAVIKQQAVKLAEDIRLAPEYQRPSLW